jgi:3-mercaptopyruvate sulfurtransferase SseA
MSVQSIALAAPSIAAAMLRRLHGVGSSTVGGSGQSSAAGRVRFLDCRIADEVDETAAEFKSCRVPGAQLLRLADLDAATDATARLPPAAAVLEQLRALGVRSTDALVLYDAERSLTQCV